MKLRNFTIAATIAALVLAAASPATAVGGGPDGNTCDDVISGSGWETKVNVSGEHATIEYTAPAGYAVDQYCVKTGSVRQDGYGPVLVDVAPASSTVTIDYPEPPADAGKQKAISHYVIHLIEVGEPEQPEQPEDTVEFSAWTESWECGDEVASLERSFTRTSWVWGDGEWSPVATSGLERDTRPLTDAELASCEETEPEEPTDADIDGTVAGAFCTPDAPYLRYEIVVNDPDGTLDGKATATITFVNPDGDDWTVTVAIGAGSILWPGVTIDSEGKATAWPGWTYDADLERWVDVGNDNYGWTRAELTQVKVEVPPSKTFYVNYPKASPECASAPTSQVLVVIGESGTTTDAPAAAPVAAEVAYTG